MRPPVPFIPQTVDWRRSSRSVSFFWRICLALVGAAVWGAIGEGIFAAAPSNEAKDASPAAVAKTGKETESTPVAPATDAAGDAPAKRLDVSASQRERLRALVYRRPQSTATFDRWYDLARQAGALPQLNDEVQAYRREHPQEAAAHMVAALVSEKSRDWPAALEAWNAAAALTPRDYFPLARRAEVQLRQQEFEKAAESLTAALRLEVPPAEYPRLARQQVSLALRGGDSAATARALEAWRQRAGEDAGVLREIAQRYLQIQQLDDARLTWQQLASLRRAPADLRFEARLQLALLRGQRGDPPAARAELRTLLSEVEPQGARADRLRQALNATFVDSRREAPSSDDAAKLARVEFWKGYADEHPADLAAWIEWSDALVAAGRAEAALDACRAALLRAPNHRPLRERIVNILLQGGDYKAAAEELKLLAEKAGDDWSLLVDAGKLRLQRSDLDEEAAQREAIQAWQQAVERFPRDPLVARAVADACHEAALGDSPDAWDSRPRDAYPEEIRRRRTPLWDMATAQYREAAKRDPSADHAQQVAWLLHRLGRSEEAVAAWLQAATAAPESADRWLETSGELARAGYGAAALDAAEKASQLDASSPQAWTRWLEMCVAQNQYDRAVASLDRMRTVRPRDPAWQTEVRQWQARLAVVAQRAEARLQELAQRLQPSGDENEDRDDAWVEAAWEWLLLREATGQLTADDPVLGQLAERLGESPHERLRLAVLMQEADRLDDAVRLYEAAAAPRGAPRKEIYRRWTELELRRGQPAAALAVAQRLARELPRDVESHLLLATVLGRQGDRESQVEELRAAIAIAPRDVTARRQLASLLQQEGRADEARAEALEAVRQANSVTEMESLLTWMSGWTRSEGERAEVNEVLRGMVAAEPKRQDERSQALAFWLEQTGDARAALQQLEELQARQPLDASRLRKVVELARQTDEHEVAIRYQKQLLQLNPSPANRELLAQLYRQAGRMDDASAIWSELLDYRGTEDEAGRLVDDLVARADLFAAQRMVEAALTRHPDSWRLGYRAALVHVALGQEAAARNELLRLLQQAPVTEDAGGRPGRSIEQELALLEWFASADVRLRLARWKRAQAGRDRDRDPTRYFAEELVEPLADGGSERVRMACSLLALRLLPDRLGAEELRALVDAQPGNHTLRRAVATTLWIDGDASGVVAGLDRPGGDSARESFEEEIWPHLLRLLRFGTGTVPPDAAQSTAIRSDGDALRQLAGDWDWLHRRDAESAEALHAYLATRVCMAAASTARDELVAERIRQVTTIDALGEWLVAIRYLAPELQETLHGALREAAAPTRSLAGRGGVPRGETVQRMVEFALQRPAPEADDWRAFVAQWLQRFRASERAEGGAATEVMPISRTLERLRQRLREDAALEEKQREGPALGLAGMADGSPFLDRDAVADLRRLLATPSAEWKEIDAQRTLRARPAVANTNRDRTGFPVADRFWSDRGLRLLERVAAAFPEPTPSRAAFAEQLGVAWQENAADAASLDVALASLDWWWNERPCAVARLEQLVRREPASLEARASLARAYLNSDQLDAAYQLLGDTTLSRPAGAADEGDWRDLADLTQAVWTRWSERLHWRDLQGHAGAVTALAADPRGRLLASVGVDGIVRIWDPTTGTLVHALRGHEDMLMSVAFADDGAWIATAGYDRVVRRWDAATGKPLAQLAGHSAVVRALAIDPDGDRLASAGDDRQVLVWNTATGEVAGRLPVDATVQALAFARQGRQLIALQADGQVISWSLDAAAGSEPASALPTPQEGESPPAVRWATGVSSARALVGIAPDTVVVAGESGGVAVGKQQAAGEAWQQQFTLSSASPVRGLAYSGPSATLSVGCEDQLVHVWDMARRKEALVLKGHTGRILAVATPVDGQWLASSGFDGTIKIWRLREAAASSESLDR